MTKKSVTQTMACETETIYGFSERPKVSSSRDAHEILKRHYASLDDSIETFHLLILSRANTVIAHKLVSIGGTSGTVADPKIIFRYALTTKGAAAMIIAHNHPSCSLTASQSDIDLTRKLKEGGKLLEMQLLDHLIVTPDNRYFSFADDGIL